MSTISRKHYDMLASAIRRARYTLYIRYAANGAESELELALGTVAGYIADVLAQLNPSFDREHFLANCDVQPNNGAHNA